jgi:hypothetical protein
MSLSFEWTDEHRYRRVWREMIGDRRTKSMRSIGGAGLPTNIRLTPRYELLVRRSAREFPAQEARRELRASLAHLAEWAREAVLDPYRGVEIGECLLIARNYIEWIVDDGQAEVVGTVFVRTGGTILTTLADSFPLGPNYAIDRLLLETERRHTTNS